MAMDVRHISPIGEINIGDTQIWTLRKAYGAHFAEGCHGSEKLRDVLHQMDEPSRSTLIQDQLLGKLDEICRQAT